MIEPHDDHGPLPVRDSIALVALGIFLAAAALGLRALEGWLNLPPA